MINKNVFWVIGLVFWVLTIGCEAKKETNILFSKIGNSSNNVFNQKNTGLFLTDMPIYQMDIPAPIHGAFMRNYVCIKAQKVYFLTLSPACDYALKDYEVFPKLDTISKELPSLCNIDTCLGIDFGLAIGDSEEVHFSNFYTYHKLSLMEKNYVEEIQDTCFHFLNSTIKGNGSENKVGIIASRLYGILGIYVVEDYENRLPCLKYQRGYMENVFARNPIANCTQPYRLGIRTPDVNLAKIPYLQSKPKAMLKD